ncbi:hypothetical protein O181_063508 [Austropuccinia psidii MF-1]|uniref:Uncharacterized protein n=1 Tax=Austropuccinia psidii MF-1 TaxID=1389203 RepID=A0A9Q3I0N5_9BASI|nr:hypothetical protein [Austropuccinia psidii MF-1]
MSTPLNQNDGKRISNPHLLYVENSQQKNKFSTSFHSFYPSMGLPLLKEEPKPKKWSHLSGQGEYDHTELTGAHRWYIKLKPAHRNQSWTWWKTQIINKWANDAWRFKVETAFEYSKFNADKNRALPWFSQQKDRLTALYPDMSEFMIHIKTLRQYGGDLEHAVKSRTTEQSSVEDMINISEEVNARVRIGSSRVKLKAIVNTP